MTAFEELFFFFILFKTKLCSGNLSANGMINIFANNLETAKKCFQIIFIYFWSDHCFPFQIPHWLRMMYWVNTVNIFVNEHWKYFTFWAVANLLGSTPGCWQQQGGEKKNQPASQHFFFCLFLLSPNDCGHHPIFWFFLPQLQNFSDFVTNRFMVNLPKRT